MPVGLAQDPSVDLDRLDSGASGLPVANSTGYGAVFNAARQFGNTSLQFGKHLVLDTLGIDPADPVSQGHSFGDVDTRISADQANAQYGVTGYQRFNTPTTPDDAAWQSAQARQRQFTDTVLSRTNLNPLLSFGAGLAGSLTDPVGLGVMIGTGGLGDAALGLAGLGEGAEAAGQTGLAVSRLGRLANPGGIARTLAVGAIDNVPYTAANAALTNYAGGDYSLGDGLRDIAAGAILHTGVHLALRGANALLNGARGPGGEPASAFEPNPVPASGVPDAVNDLPPAARRGAFAMALDQAISDRPVDVGQYVARELEPPTLDRLNEPTAAPAIASWRPLQDDTAVTTRGTEVPVRYGLAELSDLTTSHDDNLSVNPAYPAELQPRARDRAGAQARNYQLESELNPKLLMNDVGAGSGAPIVAPDGVVESGNGRTIALRRSAASGGEAYTRYKAQLSAAGFDATGMQNPVLVRMRTEAMDGGSRAQLAREMNADVTERMSATEQAAVDSARIPDSAWDQVGDKETPTTSRGFARDFIARVAPDQANAMASADGALSPEGARRIKAAVLHRAYGDPRLVGQIFEDEASDVRKLGEGLADAAPGWARMRAAASRGEIPRELDLTDNLRTAMDLARHAKAEGRALGDLVAELIGQHELFGGETISPQTEAMLRLLYRDPEFKKPLPPARIAAALKDYARQALEVRPGKDLFGDTAGEDTARQILSNLAERFAAGDAGDIDTVRAPGKSAGDAEPRASVIDVRQPGGDGDGAGSGLSPDAGDGAGGEGEGDAGAAERTRGPTGDQLIAADPELRALAEDTDRLAAENGVTVETPETLKPNTLAEAVRAAAVCLAGEME